ncbi:MAG TPA: hypothetical protein ACFYD5_03010 [Candidatus Tripitaka sp. YC43]
MRALSLLLCLLFFQGAFLAEGSEKSPPAPPATEAGKDAVGFKDTAEADIRQAVEEIEKGAVAAPVESPVTEQPMKEEKKKPEVVTPAAPPEEKRKKEKWVGIEGGFAYRGVTVHQGSYTFVTQFDGEMINNTGINYSIVKFVFSTHDSRGRVIAEDSFQIIDFKNGKVMPFKGTIVDGFKEIASFKIRLKSGVAAAKE